MRVLVTGGAGFIGSHIVDRLLPLGHDVLVVDTMETGRRDNLPLRDNLGVLESDIADDDARGACSVEESIEGFRPTVIVHAAASYADPTAWERDLRTNAIGTARLVRLAEELDVARFVYFQTSLCYGIAAPAIPLPENWTLDPSGSYAISKTAGEAYLRGSALDYISFRLANIYGPRNRSGPLPAFYKRIRAGERCTVVEDARRDFVYIDDAVDVFMRAIDGGEGERGVYHVATGRDYPIGAVYELARLALDADENADLVRRGPDDAPSILLDPTRTDLAFGWTATTRLDAGISQTVAWYDEHDIGDVYTHLRVEAEEALVKPEARS